MKPLGTTVIMTWFSILLFWSVASGITFTDVTHRAHLDNYPDCRGSAWLDYDRDGLIDLVIASESGANRLHKNQGDGSFIDVTSQVQIPQRSGLWGVNFADIDNDGFQDIYFSARAPDTLSAGRNILLYNTGQDIFLDISDSSGAGVPGGGVAACFAPFNKGPFVDLFAPNQYYPEREFPFFLYNLGNREFSDQTEYFGLHFRAWWDIPVAFDFDNDNMLELFCTKDYEGNSMYDRMGGASFVDVSDSLNIQTPCGYGVTVGDINNDGWFDLFITNWHDYYGNLLLYDSLGSYRDISQLWQARGNTWTSAAHFADFNNDGWLDLFISAAGTGNKYYQNDSGQCYVDQTNQAGLSNNNYNWGTSIGDYDNDGFLDIFVPEYYNGDGGKLYHNNGNHNNWVMFELEGNHSNRDGIGAKIVVESNNCRQMRQVMGGSGFGSQNSLIQHFGLGVDSIISRVTIFWPSRGHDIYENLLPNQTYHITEGEAISIDAEVIQTPSKFDIIKTYPNPFNATANIEIAIDCPIKLQVKIVDILGRNVKVLYSGYIEPYHLMLNWNGMDENNIPSCSGTYFCLVSDGTRISKAKLLLIK